MNNSNHMETKKKDAQFEIVGNYALLLPNFASGTFYQVFKGIKLLNDGKHYILKKYSSQISPSLRQLIEREETISKLYPFPESVVKFIEKFEYKNSIYIVTEYFEKSSNLKEFRANRKESLSIETRLKIARKIAQGIKLLHQNKFIHRNLQPNHILVNYQEDIKFTGLKYMISLYSNQYPNDQIESCPYTAPEIKGQGVLVNSYNEKVDIYSFGMILYFLFTGNEDANGINKKELDQYFIIPDGIKDLILKCVNIDPRIRPESINIDNDCYFQMNYAYSKKDVPADSGFYSQKIPVALPSKHQKEPYSIKVRADLEPYVICEQGNLGEGNFSKVFKVLNTVENVFYAMKIIKMEKLDTEKAKELIYNEANLLNKLKHLSFVTKIKEYFIYEETLYLIIEFCNGENLDKHVNWLKKNNMNMNMEDIKLIAGNLAQGLKEMQDEKHRIIHRDLKPENILLIKSEANDIIDCRIGDLGLSKQLEDNCENFFTRPGCEMYKAPELRDIYDISDTELNGKVDVYSYGLILFFMLLGKHAFYFYYHRQREFLKGEIAISEKDLLLNSTDLEEKKMLINLIQSCIKKNPKDRISFDKIVDHPFFNRLKIPEFPKDFIFSNKELIRKSLSSKGYSYVSNDKKKYYLKFYGGNTLNNDYLLKYIKREIQFLSRSKNTPHIVPFIEYGITENSMVLVFEYCNGEDLQKLAKNKGIDLTLLDRFLKVSKSFSFNEIKVVARSLIEFIDDIHGRGYLHRSINPKHILLIYEENQNEFSKIKVCGLKSAKSDSSPTQSLIPKEDAIKFEDPFAINNGFSKESDLWSIGMVIYFMAFGKLPGESLELKKIRNKGTMNYPNLDIDPSIIQFIDFCISKRGQDDLSSILLADMLKESISWFN